MARRRAGLFSGGVRFSGGVVFRCGVLVSPQRHGLQLSPPAGAPNVCGGELVRFNFLDPNLVTRSIARYVVNNLVSLGSFSRGEWPPAGHSTQENLRGGARVLQRGRAAVALMLTT
jgi:hypothetical protein